MIYKNRLREKKAIRNLSPVRWKWSELLKDILNQLRITTSAFVLRRLLYGFCRLQSGRTLLESELIREQVSCCLFRFVGAYNHHRFEFSVKLLPKQIDAIALVKTLIPKKKNRPDCLYVLISFQEDFRRPRKKSDDSSEENDFIVNFFLFSYIGSIVSMRIDIIWIEIENDWI